MTTEPEDKEIGIVEQRKQEFRTRYKGSKYDLVALAKVMANVQRTKEKLEDELKLVNAEFDVLRLEVIPEVMEQKGIENFTVEKLGRVSLTGDVYVSVKAGVKDQFYKWLRSKKLGDLITDTVNSSMLKAWVKGRVKDNKPWPKELLNVSPFTRASITRG